jgi:hypothetical protein
MTGSEGKVRLQVKDGAVVGATVNDRAIPMDRVQFDGKGLKVVDERGAVIGWMAQLPEDMKRPKIGLFNDNPDLKIRIENDRELVVTYRGETVPADRIRMENGELRIFSAGGDLLRIIPADSSRLEKAKPMR